MSAKTILTLEELLLRKKAEAISDPGIASISTEKADRLRSDQGATVDSFIEMISMLVGKTMRKENVEFVPDEGARLSVDQCKEIDHPYILFDVIERRLMQELKPRVRELVGVEPPLDKDGRPGAIFGQKFTCIIQFDVFACDYKTANKVMNDFERLIFKFTSYFKKNGVSEVLFQRQMTDRNLDIYRQSASIRSLQYRVDFETLFVLFASENVAVLMGE